MAYGQKELAGCTVLTSISRQEPLGATLASVPELVRKHGSWGTVPGYCGYKAQERGLAHLPEPLYFDVAVQGNGVYLWNPGCC